MNDKLTEQLKSELEQKLETASPAAISYKLAAEVLIQIQKLHQDKKS